jgi:long-chain acyl-CoA synthetase
LSDPIGLTEVAEAFPDRVAIIEPERGSLTFAELRDRVHRTANALVSRGLRPGDVVASVMPNRREYHELRLGTELVSLYFTPISHHLTAPEISYILRDSGARLLVVEASLVDLVADAVAEAGLTADDVVVVGAPYEEWLATADPSPPASPGAGDFMGYTSGTTGRPKAVRRPLTGRAPGVGQSRVDFMARLGIEPGQHVHLVGSPLYHAAPGTFSTIALHLGHTVVISERPRAEQLLELIERHRVAYTFTVPPCWAAGSGCPTRSAHSTTSPAFAASCTRALPARRRSSATPSTGWDPPSTSSTAPPRAR